MLLVALSAFQSRTQDDAFERVTRHALDGIQLTPGNLPCDGFRERVDAFGGVARLHHGFAWERYRRAVYDSSFRPDGIGRDHSVHPPRASAPARRGPTRAPVATTTFEEWLPIALEHDLLVETMYPGYVLGTGAELDAAMSAGLRLAVDVSHLEIQRFAGVLDEATQRRVCDYDRVEEIHVSRSAGLRDAHLPIDGRTPGVDWARERVDEVPVVLESYWHRVEVGEQARQLELLRS